MYDSKYTGQQIEEMLERAGSDLIEAGEDESYVVKVVDAEGALLMGFTPTSEIAVPTGLTDDAYTLIKALYEKLGDAVDYMKTLPTTGGGGSDLIEEGTDSTYVLKMQDSEGNLLQGFKETGEVEIPSGISDDAYMLINALYEKVNEIAQYLKNTK